MNKMSKEIIDKLYAMTNKKSILFFNDSIFNVYKIIDIVLTEDELDMLSEKITKIFEKKYGKKIILPIEYFNKEKTLLIKFKLAKGITLRKF